MLLHVDVDDPPTGSSDWTDSTPWNKPHFWPKHSRYAVHIMQAILHQQTTPKAFCCGQLWHVLQLNHQLLFVQESSNLIALIMKQQCPQTAPALQPLHRDHNCPLHHHIGFLILYFYANCCLFTDECADFPALIICNESRHREVDIEEWNIYALVCIFHYDELASLSEFQVSGSWIWWCSDRTPMEGRKKSFKKNSTACISYEMDGSNVKLSTQFTELIVQNHWNCPVIMPRSWLLACCSYIMQYPSKICCHNLWRKLWFLLKSLCSEGHGA